MNRAAIYYESRLGRNDGSPLYMQNLLRERFGADGVHLVPDGNYAQQGKFDMHLWIDWGEDAVKHLIAYDITLPEHDKKTSPLVYVASDTHLGPEHRVEMAKKADYVFVNQKEAVELMKANGVDAQWMPHAVEPRAFPNIPKAMKRYDVCFVGHLVSRERIEFLDAMFKAFPNFYFGSKLSRYVQDTGQIDDIADTFRKTKVVLNPPTKGDVNMRVFETLATESFLLTQRVPGIEDLFTDGVHLVLYDTIEQAIEKAHYYLEHEQERDAIAKAGYEEVMAKHTYNNRLDNILKTIKE